MNHQHRARNPEEALVCPYEKAHTMLRKRMAVHLTRCREQHKELSKLMKTCSYNCNHIVPAIEIPFHEENCEDRDSFMVNMYQVGADPNPSVADLVENTKVHFKIDASEDWGDDDNTGNVNIIDNINRSADARGVLKNHMNQSKAVLRSKREEDLQRMRERDNARERANFDRSLMYSSSYAPSSDDKKLSNNNKFSSKLSVMSDSSSYQTDVDYISERMEGCQIARRKGRGRSLTKPYSSPGLSKGMGRGGGPKY